MVSMTPGRTTCGVIPHPAIVFVYTAFSSLCNEPLLWGMEAFGREYLNGRASLVHGTAEGVDDGL